MGVIVAQTEVNILGNNWSSIADFFIYGKRKQRTPPEYKVWQESLG
jgi:hypothetical protein